MLDHIQNIEVKPGLQAVASVIVSGPGKLV